MGKESSRTPYTPRPKRGKSGNRAGRCSPPPTGGRPGEPKSHQHQANATRETWARDGWQGTLGINLSTLGGPARLRLNPRHVQYHISMKQEEKRLPQRAQMCAFIGRTIDTHVSHAFVVVAITGRIRTGYIEPHTTVGTFRRHVRLLLPPRALSPGGRPLAPLPLSADRCARIAAHFNNVQAKGLHRGRAQQGIVPVYFLNFFLRKRHPALLGITKEASMQTTIAQRHTSSLCVRV